MTRILLFAGPSLPRDRSSIDDRIVLRPPARGGDLIRALADRPAAIALVDGVFETAPAVAHKEVLAVIDAGVPVYGAASLGALRAAELDSCGMIGVGAIYEAYRDGGLESDAAVMVSHAPAELDHRPLTVALVDAEASLVAAALGRQEYGALLSIARRIGFRDRTWPAIFAVYAGTVGVDAARSASARVAAVAFSQKERDVATLLVRLTTDEPVPPPRFTLPRTVFLERLVNRHHAPAPGAPVP